MLLLDARSVLLQFTLLGTLPAFSWISPKHEAADHPCLDIGKGKRSKAGRLSRFARLAVT